MYTLNKFIHISQSYHILMISDPYIIIYIFYHTCQLFQIQKYPMQETQQPTYDWFDIKSNIFELKVCYHHNRMFLSLEDYTDWVVYEKEYADDVGSEDIHKKVDLADIYYSLTEAFGKNLSNTTPQNQQEQENPIMEYKQGETITKNNIPFYKIQQKGLITVYVSMMDKRKQEEVIYQSNLQLVKDRDMTQIQILKKKFAIEKWNLFKQKKVILDKLAQLEKENQQLKKLGNGQTSKPLEGMGEKRDQQIEQLKNKQTNKLKEQKEHLLTQVESLKSEKKIISTIHQQKMKSLSGYTTVKLYYNGYQNSINYGPISSKNLRFSFKVKLLKIPCVNQPYIGIGILDITKYKKPTTLYNLEGVIGYYCWNINTGIIYPGEHKQGAGYKQGSTIEVSVDLQKCEIMWKCQDKVLVRYANDMLKQQSREYVPFVETYYKETEFQWVV